MHRHPVWMSAFNLPGTSCVTLGKITELLLAAFSLSIKEKVWAEVSKVPSSSYLLLRQQLNGCSQYFPFSKAEGPKLYKNIMCVCV